MSNEPKAFISMLMAVMCFVTAGFLFYEVSLIHQKKYAESFLYQPTKDIVNSLSGVLND